ncbi:hypothetical protein [Amniculibacterium aquaticum]|jgi:hypothetical protein|uniref:hypothetical protein n=1 Tax=Amniculibacterium aquaticum TaxID=2479858 RepID=UPI000F593BF9|nr:hypothetical protein [Amniculibacterium aquaticum]
MRKINNTVLSLITIWFCFLSCNNKVEEKSELDTLRKSNNKKSYPVTKMDSIQAIQFITKQKIQELFDLSALYTSGTKDTEIDSIIYQQMMGYFEKPDSAKVSSTLLQMDSLKVRKAKIGDLEVNKVIEGKDTMDLAKFKVEFFGENNKKIGDFDKTVRYTLTTNPVKFKKEFKFYFVDFDIKAPKDSTSLGKTK